MGRPSRSTQDLLTSREVALAADITPRNFALLHDWAIGRMSDAGLRIHGPLAQLVLLASVSKGGTALSVERLIADHRAVPAPA